VGAFAFWIDKQEGNRKKSLEIIFADLDENMFESLVI